MKYLTSIACIMYVEDKRQKTKDKRQKIKEKRQKRKDKRQKTKDRTNRIEIARWAILVPPAPRLRWPEKVTDCRCGQKDKRLRVKGRKAQSKAKVRG